jgi:type IV pilus assembly protein PilQ
MRTIPSFILAGLLGFAAPGIPAAQAQQPAPNSVQSLDYASLPGGTIAVKIVFERELKELPDVFAIYHPANRIVLDFPNMRSAVSKSPLEVRQRGLWTLQVVRSGTRARVIIDLLQPMIREMEMTGNELLIILSRPQRS